jgi:group II intron reverse transcriptase/maturase
MPEKLRKLQSTLYRQAKASPRWRAWSLCGEVWRIEVLEYELKQVTENGGGPGVDGVRVETLKDGERRESLLRELQDELRQKRYAPQPVKRVHVPKADGKLRPLGIPAVRDRVAQTAVMLLLAPIFEADFHANSFAYRPGKDAHQAMDAVRKAMWGGQTEVVDADISSYFDSIPHDQLMKEVSRRASDGSILAFIKAWLTAPVVEEDGQGRTKRSKPRSGTPQGGVLSPLLANLHLNRLDHQANDECGLRPTLVRYADDLVMLCRKGQGRSLKERLGRYLKAKGLTLNAEKTRVVDGKQESFEFLGFVVRWRKSSKSGKSHPHVEPSAKAQGRLREKIRAWLDKSTRWKQTQEVMDEANRILRGWANYFHYANSTRVFNQVQYWVRNRLRRWLWRKCACRHGLFTHYTDRCLHERCGLYELPLWAKWRHANG